MGSKEKEFGEYLRKIRKEKGFTIRQLELKANVSNAYLSQLENGKRGRASTSILKKIAKALDVPYTTLLHQAGHLEEDYQYSMDEGIATINETIDKYRSSHITVPVLKNITAGKPIFSEEHIEDFAEIPSNSFAIKKDNFFFYHAKDNSMLNARIHENDMLLVQVKDDVKTGEIAILNISNEDAIIRTVRKTDSDTVWLFAENDEYEPILTSKNDIRIVGKVVKVLVNI